MAGSGPPPKAAATRQRRNSQPETTTVAIPTVERGPELPEIDTPWHPRTVEWWATWQASGLVRTEVEWQFLLDTALMHHTMWEKSRWEFASELRIRVAKFGATPEDRMRLRIELGDDKPPTVGSSPGVTDIASRRARLTG